MNKIKIDGPLNGILILSYLNNILTKVNDMKGRVDNHFDGDPIVCYRGESKLYPKPIMPSFFRSNKQIYESDLLELLVDYEVTNADKNIIGKLIDSQHYIAFSKLLDITFNILPAIYFATDNYDEDGYLYIFTFPENFSPNSNYLNKYYENIVNHQIKAHRRDFKVISHSYSNERIKAQNGGFILFPSDYYQEIPSEYYSKIKIHSKDKEILRHELSAFFNIKEATIYPEKDKRKEMIVSQLESLKRVQVLADNYKIVCDEFLQKLRFEINNLEHSDTFNHKVNNAILKNKNDFNYFKKHYMARKARKEIDDFKKHAEFNYPDEEIEISKYLKQQKEYIIFKIIF